MHAAKLTADERESEMSQLREMREYVWNIEMVFDIFGWCVTPLMSHAP